MFSYGNNLFRIKVTLWITIIWHEIISSNLADQGNYRVE